MKVGTSWILNASGVFDSGPDGSNYYYTYPYTSVGDLIDCLFVTGRWGRFSNMYVEVIK